ncbi:hypothetical protein N3K66_006407 [Trichothecium roseum]|uniref:Uncharacterized protein n=1 Tax=Trichothecium roseum TaxID=47278 RepID=A0ACC0UVC2_9HYPO|nr:hypothetical protein N3K66_006407 [Trichothecium roseum]
MVLPHDIKLQVGADWIDWIMALETHARKIGIWDQIDPYKSQGDDASAAAAVAPSEPTRIRLKHVKGYIRTEFGVVEPDLQLQVQVHKALLDEYRDDKKEYDAFVGREEEIRDWIVSTVDAGIYQAAMLPTAARTQDTHKWQHGKEQTPIREILQRLIKTLDCFQGYLKRQARMDYVAIMREIESPSLDFDVWYARWCRAYVRTIKYGGPPEGSEKKGMNAFVQAVDEAGISPRWSSMMSTLVQDNQQDGDEKEAPKTLPDMVADLLGYRHYTAAVKALSEMDQMDPPSPQKDDEGGGGDEGPQEDQRVSYSCPCEPGSGEHAWAPETCAKLEYAVRGICERDLAQKPSEKEAREIRERLEGDRACAKSCGVWQFINPDGILELPEEPAAQNRLVKLSEVKKWMKDELDILQPSLQEQLQVHTALRLEYQAELAAEKKRTPSHKEHIRQILEWIEVTVAPDIYQEALVEMLSSKGDEDFWMAPLSTRDILRGL